MARARLVSVQIASDDNLNKLSPDAERLYLRTLPHLDRDGLITGHPMLLWAKVAPLRMELMDVCNALIQEWVQQGLVVRYPGADGQPVLYFKGFRRHNANIPYTDEAPSIYPPPPGWLRTKHGIMPEDKEACFQLASRFHPENKYRKTLLDYAMSDDTSRSGLEGSSGTLEQFEPRTEQNRSVENGGGGVQDTPATHPRSGNGGEWGGAPTRLISALAEISDDELRMAADGLGSLFGLKEDYTNWTRTLAAASRAELLCIIAWCWKWSTGADKGIESYAAVLAARKKALSFPDNLSSWQIHEIRDQVEEAVRLMSIPVEEL